MRRFLKVVLAIGALFQTDVGFSMPRGCIETVGMYQNGVLDIAYTQNCVFGGGACRVDSTPAMGADIKIRYSNFNPVLKERYREYPDLAVLDRPLEATVRTYEDARAQMRSGFDPKEIIFKELDILFDKAKTGGRNFGEFGDLLVTPQGEFRLGTTGASSGPLTPLTLEGDYVSPLLDQDGAASQFNALEVNRQAVIGGDDPRGKVWLIASDVPGELITPEEIAFSYEIFSNQFAHTMEMLPRELGRPLTSEEVTGLAAQMIQVIKVSPDPQDPNRRIVSNFNPSQMEINPGR